METHPFQPAPLWASAHWQTISAFYLPTGPDLEPDETHHIDLGDGDRLLLMENRPAEPSRRRIVLLVHGLSGSYRSNFMVRLNRRFVNAGYTCFRLNLRGCGPGWDLARRPCHAGRSEDLRKTLDWLQERHPDIPVTVIAFSLGANILLKMLGEDGRRARGRIDRFIAVSPPLDLRRCIDHMAKPANQLFSYFFTLRLKQDIRKIQSRFPELAAVDVSACRHVIEIDETYTAPLSGYTGADHYYRECSSGRFIPEIRVPGWILGAYDDPIVDGAVYRHMPENANIRTLFTERGGHVGFLDNPWSRRPLRWMDEAIERWLGD